MPAAEQDLSDFLSHSRMAGSDLEAVVDIMRQVATHLQLTPQLLYDELVNTKE